MVSVFGHRSVFMPACFSASSTCAVRAIGVLVVLLGAATSSPAYALCHGGGIGVDADGDGWCHPGDTPTDCDDSDSLIFPDASEDGIDDVDNDCDDSVLVHRQYVQSMESNVLSAGHDFATHGGGAATGSSSGVDYVRFSGGGTAFMTLGNNLPWATGQFTLVLRVAAQTGTPNCLVRVRSSSMGADADVAYSGVGEHALVFSGVEPGDTVTKLQVRCLGPGGTSDLSWLTVQNGPYVFAPMDDTLSEPETMGMPGVGRQAMIRSSFANDAWATGALMFVGSDVGGFGWSDDGGRSWYAANGNGLDWMEPQYGVWEAWAIDTGTTATQPVVVLSGDKDAAGGGLYYTDFLGAQNQGWAEVLTPAVSPDLPLRLGANKHRDDCSNLNEDYYPIGSGRLIVNAQGDDSTLLVASANDDTRGLWAYDVAGHTLTEATWLSTFSGLVTPALPAALAIDSSNSWMLVGYRPVAENGVADYGALWACPVDFDASTTEMCVQISSDSDPEWIGDVRDIEPDPVIAGRFYVADGGRRWDGSSACDASESTVFVVDVSGTFPTSLSPGTLAATVDDTDDTSTDYVPDWEASTDGSAGYYYGSGASGTADAACVDGTSSQTIGDLVPPRSLPSEGYEISSIAIDPDGDFLFAFYPLTDNKREYGCVRSFRVAAGDVSPGATPWQPFQGWDWDDMRYTDGSHPAARRSYVDVVGASHNAFMSSEPLLEDWGGAGTHDAAFVDAGAANGYSLLMGGNFLWLVDPLSAATGHGWDTVPTHVADYDLDEMPVRLAWDEESSVFQDATVRSVAVCSACMQFAATTIDLAIVAGMGDYKMANLYAKVTGGDRLPATRPCEAHMLLSSGTDVAIWQTGSHSGEAWMSLAAQGADHTDAGHTHALLYNADVTSDDWCFDAVGAPTPASTLAGGNFLHDRWDVSSREWTGAADGVYEMHCQDAGQQDADVPQAGTFWDSCDADMTEGWHLGNAVDDTSTPVAVGQIRSIAPIAAQTALLAAAQADDLLTSTDDGGGVWLATYTYPSGIDYEKIPWTDPFGGCTEDDFFEWEGQTTIVYDRDPNVASAYDVVAYLTSKNCGVAKLEFNYSDPAGTADWNPVDTSDCTNLATGRIRGAALSRDSRWLMVFGGPDADLCAVDLTDSGDMGTAVIGSGDLDIQIRSVLPHPHLDDTFYIGGYTDGGADPGGVLTLEHAFRPATNDWTWNFRLLGLGSFEHRTVEDIAWGAGTGTDDELHEIYAATGGGGVWDLHLTGE
jgi:hypothetical protein